METQGDDMAIVEVEGIGKVELRVQDLEHISLVIDEVACFKYLGLNLEYALRMEEATEAGGKVYGSRAIFCFCKNK